MEKWDKIENWTQNKPRIEDKLRNKNRTKIEKMEIKKLKKTKIEKIGDWKKLKN